MDSSVTGVATNTGTVSGSFYTKEWPVYITTTSLPSGYVGYFYDGGLAAEVVNPTWSLSSGSLPPGLTLGSVGKISGTPTTAGTFNFTVKAVSGSNSDTKNLSITVK